jgi:hypothetical protein
MNQPQCALRSTAAPCSQTGSCWPAVVREGAGMKDTHGMTKNAGILPTTPCSHTGSCWPKVRGWGCRCREARGFGGCTKVDLATAALVPPAQHTIKGRHHHSIHFVWQYHLQLHSPPPQHHLPADPPLPAASASFVLNSGSSSPTLERPPCISNAPLEIKKITHLCIIVQHSLHFLQHLL